MKSGGSGESKGEFYLLPSAMLSRSIAAFSVNFLKLFSSIAFLSSRAVPTPTAHAPALNHSPALVSVTPPDWH